MCAYSNEVGIFIKSIFLLFKANKQKGNSCDENFQLCVNIFHKRALQCCNFTSLELVCMWITLCYSFIYRITFLVTAKSNIHVCRSTVTRYQLHTFY